MKEIDMSVLSNKEVGVRDGEGYAVTEGKYKRYFRMDKKLNRFLEKYLHGVFFWSIHHAVQYTHRVIILTVIHRRIVSFLCSYYLRLGE
jgi:hypothetical protein